MVGDEAARHSGVVLIVEDDVLLRMVTASSLRDAGFEVIEAVNAAEAVVVLNSVTVDALISDVNMPGRMDGIGLAKWVRGRGLATEIIRTSAAQPSSGTAEEYGCFLAKPYTDCDVQQLLRRVLSR
jgi:CheY-like chemotaxis protein